MKSRQKQKYRTEIHSRLSLGIISIYTAKTPIIIEITEVLLGTPLGTRTLDTLIKRIIKHN